MARPPKQTVDYFSHDADASNGRTITILENHFGAEGYTVWFKLLERLAKTNNHVIRCVNGDDMEFLAANIKLTPERLEEIFNKMAEIDAIDFELWQHRIIWSQNFVDRLEDVYANRKQDLPEKPVIMDNNQVSKLETPVSTTNKPQSKLKETKVNNIIAKNAILLDEKRYDEIWVDEAHTLGGIIRTFKEGGAYKGVLNYYRSRVEKMGIDLDLLLTKEVQDA